jgi:hypothetical protein
MKKFAVVGLAGFLLISLSGCSSSEPESSAPLPLSGHCLTVQSKIARAITYMGGAGSKYTESEVLSAVSENAQKLDDVLGTYDFLPSEKTLIRGITDGLFEIKMAISTGEGDISNAIDVVNSGFTQITELCATVD